MIYNHPNIRELSHEQLQSRLQEIRDRRLVAAILYEKERKTKVEKLQGQLHSKWVKQNERNFSALERINEAIDRLERGIENQIKISHDLHLTEQEFEL